MASVKVVRKFFLAAFSAFSKVAFAPTNEFSDDLSKHETNHG